MAEPRILIVAGEASGEAHAARLAQALKVQAPGCEIYGVGGPQMRAAGVHLLAEEDLGVIGFSEVLRRLPALQRVRRRLDRFLEDERPDLFVPVDYPGFNLRLCDIAKRYGIRVMYYISPQVWAWGRGRIKKIARRVDKMVTILPFEQSLYEAAGVDVEFVGHPLLESLEPEVSPEEFRREIGARGHERIVGLLPGSRDQEVARLFPIMLETARRLQSERADLRFVAAAASVQREEQLGRLGRSHVPLIQVVRGRTRSVLQGSDLVLVASGTATLEAACLETPMVVLYRLSFLSWLIGRALIRVPHIALANLVAGERVVPELIQYDAVPSKVAKAAAGLLDSTERMSAVRAKLREVKNRLGTRGASERAASAALSLVSQRLEVRSP